MGVVLGVVAWATVKNPKVLTTSRQKEMQDVSEEEEKKMNPMREFAKTIKGLWMNPTAKWVTLGGSFRFFEAFTAVYFLPSFY